MTAEATEKRDLDLTGITAAEIATFHGDISVVAGATPARLEARISGNATYKVEVIGTLLYIFGKKQGSSYANGEVSLRLWLPTGLALKLATVKGTIAISGSVSKLEAATTIGAIATTATGACDMRLTASSGDITVRGTTGVHKFATSHGNIQLEDAGDQIHAATSHGSIHLRKITGQLRADTSHGEIRCDESTGQLRLVTSNGEIRIAQTTGQIQAVTSNGNVRLERVRFAAGSQNWAKTSNGAVELRGFSAPEGMHLHAKGYSRQIHAELSGYALQLERDQLRATLPGGNPAQLEVVTTKKIDIIAQPATISSDS